MEHFLLAGSCFAVLFATVFPCHKTNRADCSPDRRPSLQASRLLLQSAWDLKGPVARAASRAIDLVALHGILSVWFSGVFIFMDIQFEPNKW